MAKYLKFAPDPDAKVCHCGDGNPDCDHWESCDGCGMDYRKHEGHDCIDGVPVQDLRALAKELRDSLASCETERDRLRAQLAALQSVPQGVEVPKRAAWLTIEEIADAVMCGIPTTQTIARRVAKEIANASIAKGSRLAPAPPQPAPGAVIEAGEFRREDRYVVLKRTDLERHATPAQLRELERTCGMVRAGRATEGKRLKSYVVVADNWPEYEETWAKIQARVTGIPQPIQPEGRRVGPDEVVVPRSAAEYAILAFDWIECPDPEHYEALRSFHDALRTSAQAHNGEESK